LISDLCSYLESYLPAEQIREVYRAYLYSAEAHEGQKRKSGEPYIFHPVAVARILAELRMDYRCLMAAILHDVIEDTKVSREILAKEFGDEVARLVDGVTKLTQMDFETRAAAQAASLQKMLLAMTRDIRVILIKLADRLHNMRTLDAFGRAKVIRIAQETQEIYVPIAQRLGINSLRVELEDLSFAHANPWRQRILADAVRRVRGARKELISSVSSAIRDRLYRDDLPGEVLGRQKHLFSIYRKMKEKSLTLSEVMDMYGFRIIVDRVDSCYRALGLVHNLYKPVPGRFKDYIAIPKSNGYQSLHTVLIGPNGVHMEIQIRTLNMHRTAESGVAAHWNYKQGDHGENQTRTAAWLKNLAELKNTTENSVDFLNNVKSDLFPAEVYVFTPRGRIQVLPKGASALDFAYAVHTDLGNTCVSARVDRRLVPLRTILHNGQTVEIITAKNARPKLDWLDFAITGKARSNIRAYLKNLHNQQAAQLGKSVLEKELAVFDLTLDSLEPALVKQFLKEAHLSSLTGLLVEVGLGSRPAPLVAQRLADGRKPSVEAQPVAIKGTEGFVVTYADCCRPVVGDAVVGLFNSGEGLLIHRQGCRWLGERSKSGRSWIDVNWKPNTQLALPVEILVDAQDQPGVLGEVTAILGTLDANIEDVGIRVQDGFSSSIKLTFKVQDRRHLAVIMRRLRSLPRVLRIQRRGR
jgi:RelA/SpoT family (p)ppGpp synthetase